MYARTTVAFDASFQPFFAKRVFVGKWKGNNIDAWKNGGRIHFRKPLPKGRLDIRMLSILLSRLGGLFAENGISVRLHSLKERKRKAP
jgi:hypothetical protein